MIAGVGVIVLCLNSVNSPLKKRPLRQVKMAELTEPLIGELAAAISVDVMEKIALGRFNISYAALRNIKSNERGNAQAVSREILRTWSYKNPDNQLKV